MDKKVLSSRKTASFALPESERQDRPDLMPKDEGLTSFTLGYFRFHFRALDDLSLPPYKGALIRGGFGRAIRELSCLPNWKHECSRCLLKGDCAYSYLFETPNDLESEFLRKVSHAPHPFVLRPPLSPETSYRAGDTFEVGMVLIGNALRLVPRVICAFEHFGTKGIGRGRGRFRLETVSAGYGPYPTTIYSAEEGILSETSFIMTAREVARGSDYPDVTEMIIEIVTPLRIKRGGTLSDKLTFTSLMTGLLRRVYLLDHWHCCGNLGFDHRALIELSGRVTSVRHDLQWVDWERYSFRQDAKLKMGGLVGSIQFRGPLTAFVPYLRLGEVLHIGKGTALGLGMFAVKSCQ